MTRARPRVLSIRPGPAHRHDAEIERLWRELRRLLAERKSDRLSGSALSRGPTPPTTRQRMSEAAKARWARMTPAERRAKQQSMSAARSAAATARRVRRAAGAM